MVGSKISLKKKIADGRQQKPEHTPDLTDFMNDMFFGTMKTDKTAYNLTGREGDEEVDEEDDFESSTRSNSSSRQTQEWLEQARRMVAASPARCDSPSPLVGSPRFAAAAQGRLSLSSQLDRRDPLSRSARRHRALDGFSGEILTKSAKHSRNRSETLDIGGPDSPTGESPASAVQKWFSNMLKPPNATSAEDPTVAPHISEQPQPPQRMPPRLSTHSRRSRFQSHPAVTQPQGIPPPPRRNFKTSAQAQDGQQQLLSPPRNLVESVHRRSISSATCFAPDDRVLSPLRSIVESAHRRSISSSTCSLEKIAPPKDNGNGLAREGEGERGLNPVSVNKFLKEQRGKIEKLLDGQIDARPKIVLSGPSNSTSSMVAAICYAWLLENRVSKNRGNGDEDGGNVVVPVMNFKRSRMWKHRQAAWLFHHVGLDPSSVLFADEVDLESLMMAGRLNILVVGQDVLKTNNEVGSQCTILTDNYCEEAYDLLQTALLKKLLLAGILLDTQNLSASAELSKTRDAEAVQLLLVGSAPNYRNALFDQLMQDQRDGAFIEVLRQSYGKPLSEKHRVPDRKSTSALYHEPATRGPNTKSNDATNGMPHKVSPRPDNKENTTPAQAPAKASAESAPDAGRGKNKFFLAKWFGFGSK
ncbi:uncharacterized protein LOC116215944 isoform X2 [Punica granatum]|uniref:Uncharacterized protein LOC116215944 isoform X2 n=1 Tax=Punica granatum TaxID=22663 RepID=A0A6P8ENT3_PUNGR|nr:uncharacterized protein LOC116215944 isoform X2 [Punica granatum]